MINLINIFKKYKDNNIYDDTTYSFKKNKLTCFYGASGSGKTTLLNMLAGFDCNYDGDVIVNELKIKKFNKNQLSDYRYNNIGFVFQNYHLVKGYSVLENLMIAINLNSSLSHCDKIDKCTQLINEMNLENELNQNVETLSGGQKQRVAIARALINDPNIILADEPTGALDEDNSIEIMNILQQVAKNKTVIIITHDDDILNYADEVISIVERKISVLKQYENFDSNNNDNSLNDKEASSNGYLLKNQSIKNFKINLFKFMLSSIIIAVSTASLFASFSAKDINAKIMDEFQIKNSFYNIGQVVLSKDFATFENFTDIFNSLNEMDKLSNVYMQSNIANTSITYKEKNCDISLVTPPALAKQSLSYGTMPNADNFEIAVSPSIASTLSDSINDLIGEKVIFYYHDKDDVKQEIELTITGITMDTLKNYVLSSVVEKQIFIDQDIMIDDVSAISYTVNDFDDVSMVQDELTQLGMLSYTKSEEINAYQDAFSGLLQLFSLLSYLIFIVGIIVSTITVYKTYSSRSNEIAVLAAIGYKNKQVKNMLFVESLLLTIITLILTLVFVVIINNIALSTLGFGLTINVLNICMLICFDVILIVLTIGVISVDLLKKDISVMLR